MAERHIFTGSGDGEPIEITDQQYEAVKRMAELFSAVNKQGRMEDLHQALDTADGSSGSLDNFYQILGISPEEAEQLERNARGEQPSAQELTE